MKTTLEFFTKTIATPDTAEALTTSRIFAKSVTIQALPSNTVDIMLGDSNLQFSTANGSPQLVPYQTEHYENVYLDQIYLDVDTGGAGQGVSVAYQVHKLL